MSKWVTIQKFTYPQEASVAQAKLQSMGIEAFLQDELTVQVISVYSNAMGGVKLQVPEEQYEDARKILIDGGFLKDEILVTLRSKDYPDKTICPFCGSENIDSMERPSFFTLFIYFLSRFIFIFSREDHCGDCNKNWKYVK